MNTYRSHDLRLIRDALKCFEQDHREARNDADARARDPNYEFRKQALEASNFHAEQINRLSILAAKIWRDESAALAMEQEDAKNEAAYDEKLHREEIEHDRYLDAVESELPGCPA